MLAYSAEPFDSEDFLFEPKWVGNTMLAVFYLMVLIIGIPS